MKDVLFYSIPHNGVIICYEYFKHCEAGELVRLI